MRHIRFIMTALAVGCGCPAPSFAQSGQAGPAAAMEQRSAQFAGSYLQVWSSNSSAAIAQVPRLYAPRVLFYGRVLGRRGLMREKARFADGSADEARDLTAITLRPWATKLPKHAVQRTLHRM